MMDESVGSGLIGIGLARASADERMMADPGPKEHR
jgi:hypothetical protein